MVGKLVQIGKLALGIAAAGIGVVCTLMGASMAITNMGDSETGSTEKATGSEE